MPTLNVGIYQTINVFCLPGIQERCLKKKEDEKKKSRKEKEMSKPADPFKVKTPTPRGRTLCHVDKMLSSFEDEHMLKQEVTEICDDGNAAAATIAALSGKPPNLISSKIVETKKWITFNWGKDKNKDQHMPVLDLDFEAELIPSSTSGHNHLYLNKPITWEDYEKLLRVLNEIGYIEDGVYKAALHRKATHLRWNTTKQQEI